MEPSLAIGYDQRDVCSCRSAIIPPKSTIQFFIVNAAPENQPPIDSTEHALGEHPSAGRFAPEALLASNRAAEALPNEPPRMQISVRAMMMLVALVSIVIAIWMEFGAMTGLGTTFVVLLFGAHILGALLGKSRFSEASSPRQEEASSIERSSLPGTEFADDHLESAVDSEDQPVSFPMQAKWLSVGIGAMVGALVGGGSLISVYSDQLNWWNGSVALGATAVVGGLFGFGFSNLFQVVWRFIVSLHDDNSLT